MASLMFCAVVTSVAKIKTLLRQVRRLGFDKKTTFTNYILSPKEIAVARKSFYNA